MNDAALPMTNGEVLSEEVWKRINTAYAEHGRREGFAEDRARRLWILVLILVSLLFVWTTVILWQYLHATEVQAFVQIVHQDADGTLIQNGIPIDLLTYIPQDGQWRDMLGQWIRHLRWIGEDVTVTQSQWQWVYHHTCGQARRIVQAMEDRDKPFAPPKKNVAIELKTVTKTPVPETYRVTWTEFTSDKHLPTVKHQDWTGTFSVGRYRPKTLADAIQNSLGLCVTAFDLAPIP